MKIRSPLPDEMNDVYKMGYDYWHDDMTMEKYLDECANSPKYKSADWFVLEDEGDIKASLLLHKFSEGIFGLGSISTFPQFRKHGFASALIKEVISIAEKERKAKVFFLYSEIQTKFYYKFNFLELPKDLQTHANSTCMIRGELTPQINVPKYF
jgi:N-acetylglutamate synthase-like GNAT family acetyltransferase